MKCKIKDLEFEVKCLYNRYKNGYSLRVVNGMVEFTSNRVYMKEELELLLMKHYRFLKRRLTPIENVYHQSLHVFGKEYPIQRISSNERRMLLVGDVLYLYSDDEAYNPAIVDQFYYEVLSSFIHENLEKAVSDMKLKKCPTVSYKHVKTYYGECFTKRNHLIFSTTLAKYPKEYVLSVLYHELAHFYYPNHQDAFYALLESVMPGYRKIQSSLRRTKYKDIY